MVLVPTAIGATPGVAAAWPQSSATNDALFAAAQAALSAGSPVVRKTVQDAASAADARQLISLPVRAANQAIGAIAVELVETKPETLKGNVAAIVRAAAGLGRAFEAVVAGPRRDMAATLRIQASVLSRTTLHEAATALAGEFATEFGLDRVCVGLLEAGAVRVVAYSNRGETDDAAHARPVRDAMEEAIEQHATVGVPVADDARALITMAHARLAHHRGATAVWTIPLAIAGQMYGALTLERAREATVRPDEIALWEHVACMVAPVLRLHHARELPWHLRARERSAQLRERLLGPGNWPVKLATFGSLATLAGVLLVPVDYWVGASARIEGSVQRVLVAPVDGFVGQVQVRPGDAVKADQVLMELADQDLQLERRKWESELSQHESNQSTALARSDRSEFAVSQAKAEGARAQLALVDEQLVRAKVRAPFDGVVIKGDLTQSLGAPVERGQALITVAPAEQFRLVVEVDERDIPDVRVGARGALALAALPEQTMPFRVARITPVATARDGRNFFEIEGRLEAMPKAVQPGLQGVAKIHAGEHSLAWIWTHRIVDWARLKIWAWAP